MGKSLHGSSRLFERALAREFRRRPEATAYVTIVFHEVPGVFDSFVGTKEARLFTFARGKVRIEIIANKDVLDFS